MKSHGVLQVISIVSKITAVTITTIQSIIILKILSVEEFGLLSIIVAVASFIGVGQNLGIGTATTREVSGLYNPRESHKIFIVSVVTRLSIGLPLMIAVFFGAGFIGNTVYNQPQMIQPLQLMGIVFLFHGLNGVISATLQGLKRFYAVFLLENLSAVLSIFLYIHLLNKYGFIGYFYANALYISLMTLVGLILLYQALGWNAPLPNRSDFRSIFHKIWGLSVAEYVSKIVNSGWQRISVLIVSLFVSKEVVGFLSFALDYGYKLTAVSDAINTVNLSIMSELFKSKLDSYKDKLVKSFNREFMFLVLSSALAIGFAPELIRLIFQDKYNSSLWLIPVAVGAYLAFTIYEVLRTEVLVTMNKKKQIVSTSIIMVLVTVCITTIMFMLTKSESAALIGMAVGAGIGVFLIARELSYEHAIRLFKLNNIVPVAILLPIVWMGSAPIPLHLKLIVATISVIFYVSILNYLGVVDVRRIIGIVRRFRASTRRL